MLLGMEQRMMELTCFSCRNILFQEESMKDMGETEWCPILDILCCYCATVQLLSKTTAQCRRYVEVPVDFRNNQDPAVSQ